ncbi:MAG: GDSL family lipase, partial [Verrucomicrobiales bacterium]|nr:GDSL family lipase [Verrucomicrobiales bacterium]
MIQKVFLLLVGVLVFEAPAAPLPLFQLKDGDRVAFLGDTLIERMQEFNHLELRLTTAWLKRNIIFRN